MKKAPADTLDYDIDFARWLTAEDRVTGAVSTITGSTAVIDRTDFSDTAAKIWISGGADTENGHVSTIVTTLEGRTKEFCFQLKIRECR
ncbi:unknown [Sinorhizobium phage PBC5]|nr:unknown [Sinorhizobium phage PBC5]